MPARPTYVVSVSFEALGGSFVRMTELAAPVGSAVTDGRWIAAGDDAAGPTIASRREIEKNAAATAVRRRFSAPRTTSSAMGWLSGGSPSL